MLRIIPATILSLIVMTSSSGVASEKGSAPFGLTWGMSGEQLEKHGFELEDSDQALSAFSSYSTPKPWSEADYYLALTINNKLVKIVAKAEIEDDPYGARGKKLYQRVQNLLTKRYGEPDSVRDLIGMKLYDDPDEFYQCLDYAGCGLIYTLYRPGGAISSVSLWLEGIRRGEGWVEVAYESADFAAASAARKRKAEARDEEAF